MAFRYYKRLNFGGGHGLNVSGSGASYSKRTSWGSVGTRGVSLRTGIPGLRFYQPWSFGRRGKGKAGEFLLILLVLGTIVIAYQFLAWLLKVLVWFLGYAWQWLSDLWNQYMARQLYKQKQHDSAYSFSTFNPVTLPKELRGKSLHMIKYIILPGSTVVKGQDICVVQIGKETQASIQANSNGKLKYFTREGQRIKIGDIVFMVDSTSGTSPFSKT
jgi:hypothetical protein